MAGFYSALCEGLLQIQFAFGIEFAISNLENRHFKSRVKICVGNFHFEPPANRLASALGTLRLAGRQIELHGNFSGFKSGRRGFENLSVLPEDFFFCPAVLSRAGSYFADTKKI